MAYRDIDRIQHWDETPKHKCESFISYFKGVVANFFIVTAIEVKPNTAKAAINSGSAMIRPPNTLHFYVAHMAH